MSERRAPEEGEIVFVRGGVAQYRGDVFYTGMEDPRYTRPIQWEVDWWMPISTTRCDLSQESIREKLASDLEESIQTLIWTMEQATGLKVTYLNLLRSTGKVSVELSKDTP